MGPQPFTMPHIEYSALAPVFVLFVAATLGVLIEAFVGRTLRRQLQLLVTFGSLIIALAFAITQWSSHAVVAEGALALDGPAVLLQITLLVIAIVGALLMAETKADPAGDAFAPRTSAIPGSDDEREFTMRGWTQTEIWPLFLFAVSGSILFPMANDLLTMFIALEMLSLPLYLLVGMSRRRRLLSQEAALKYFVLGAFASALFLFGAALIYAASGELTLGAIANAANQDSSTTSLMLIGAVLVLVGLFFKVGAAPFHQWSPDVYQGAPTAITAYMSAATKIAAFGAVMRLLYVGLQGLQWDWQPVVATVAVISMLVGSSAALVQTNIKRVLAYSSVAHAGFIMTAMLAVNPRGLAGALTYLVTYGFVSTAAFAVVSLVRSPAGEANDISQWAGLGRKSPVTAAVFTFLLLALAGLPLTSGFTAKFAALSSAWNGWTGGVVIAAVLTSAVAAFFYLRIIVSMYFSPAKDDIAVTVPSSLTRLAIGVCVGITTVFGFAPQAVLALVEHAGVFVS